MSEEYTACVGAASSYVRERGWWLVPVHSVYVSNLNGAVVCTCGTLGCPKPGKHPVTGTGVNAASNDPAVVDKWWSDWPWANIGVACGPSGLVVLDVDGAAGENSLRELSPPPPLTVEVATGRGRHLYFRSPEGPPVANSISALGNGLDVRSDGGYVLAPPSRHRSRLIYMWRRDLDDGVGIAPWPGWEPKGRRPTREDGEAGEVIGEGRRDATLASLAGTMRRAGMTAAEIGVALIQVNKDRVRPPLPLEDIERITYSVCRYKTALEEVPAEFRELAQQATARQAELKARLAAQKEK